MAASPESPDTQPTVVTREGVPALLRAALPSLPVVGSLPGLRKDRADAGFTVTRPTASIDPDHVRRYAELCGFPVKDTLPLTYPHMLAAPLHIAILADPRFPSQAMGMVHIENSITQHRAIALDEGLDVQTSVGSAVPHPVGKAWRLDTTVTSGDEVVWTSTSTYLRRGRRNPDAVWTDHLTDVPPSGPVFSLKSNLGRQYAAVSGDFNPIHLTPITAKALGFPRHIVHGMWSKARCVAALENRLPDAVRVDVAFKKPIFLPSSVAFGSTKVEEGFAFSLHKRGSETLHLLGRTTAL